MSVISEVKDKWSSSQKVDKKIIDEIFSELDKAIRASYEKRLIVLQDESTNASELDQKMLIASKIDEIGSWKNDLVK